MSRAGYSEGGERSGDIWKGTVQSAIRGKRGKAFLIELAAAMDAMTVKELIARELHQPQTGAVCAIGSVFVKRGVDTDAIDPEDYDAVADAAGIARSLAQEIEYVNDECAKWDLKDDAGMYRGETPAERWTRVRHWVQVAIDTGTSDIR